MESLSVRLQSTLAFSWVALCLGATIAAPSQEFTRVLTVLSMPVLGVLIWSYSGTARHALFRAIPLAAWNAIAAYFAPTMISVVMMFLGLAATTYFLFGAEPVAVRLTHYPADSRPPSRGLAAMSAGMREKKTASRSSPRCSS